jgi:hypothetical protein
MGLVVFTRNKGPNNSIGNIVFNTNHIVAMYRSNTDTFITTSECSSPEMGSDWCVMESLEQVTETVLESMRFDYSLDKSKNVVATLSAMKEGMK